MTLIHPLHSVILNNAEDLLFAIVKNEVLLFRKHDSQQYRLVGRWIDEKAARKVPAEQVRTKKARGNDGKAQEKLPAGDKGGDSPVQGSPGIQLRKMTLSPDESKLVICADSDKSVVVLKIDLQKSISQSLTCINRQSFPKRPNAIAILGETQTVVMADKFGDVYQIPMVKETVGKPGEDLLPLLGHVSMLTDIVFGKDADGKKYLITSDRDEHIKVSHYPQTFLVDKWLFGHHEFITSLHLPQWKPDWLFSVGGDACVFCWDWQSGTKLSTFDYADLIKTYLTDRHLAATRFQNEDNNLVEYAVPKVTSCIKLPFIAFFVEATRVLIILNVCQKTGKLCLQQIVDLRYNVTSLAQTCEGFAVTLDNREAGDKEFVQLIHYVEKEDKFVLDEQFRSSIDIAIDECLRDDTIANVEPDDIAPLYGAVNLKKHGEQYS